jgi:hypothetical protein
MKLANIDRIDENMQFIFAQRKESNLTDLEFATLEEIEEKAFEIIDILKEENEKTTYNNLTNMNYHTLVKILNYN